MPLPRLEPGLVVRYEYLWSHQEAAGLAAGKDRPACIVYKLSDVEAVFLPITHRPPDDRALAVEIPPRVKAQLGLDDEQSWIIIAECNVDIWPSPDLRRISGRPGEYAYGLIPPKLFRAVQRAFRAAYERQRTRVVRRTPPE